jgi:hypothetical protein
VNHGNRPEIRHDKFDSIPKPVILFVPQPAYVI